MGKIVLLDDLTINQIAAGEVIERPASAVKEMVENSIDAGATAITVEIKNGGISYIRVTDNGKGIMPDDMELSFERHATSKIRSAADLDQVKSMGFRGEALASIAAVSHVEMISKTEEAQVGNKIVVEAGNILEQEEVGCPVGTSITITNLFFNTPVRYKFLKKDFTESGYIEDVITRMALVHPEIAFKFINTGKVVIQTPGNGDMKSVIYTIYGKEIADNVLETDYQYDDITIKGVIGKPGIARSNRANQIFFVNDRYIKDKTLTSAAERGFKGLLTIGKYGFVILNIKLDPSKVDVNVHPTKLEVRFQEDSKVFKAVYHAIYDTLLKNDLIQDTEKEYTEAEKLGRAESFKTQTVQTSASLFRTPQEKKENPSSESNMMEEIYKSRMQKQEEEKKIEKENIPLFTTKTGEMPKPEENTIVKQLLELQKKIKGEIKKDQEETDQEIIKQEDKKESEEEGKVEAKQEDTKEVQEQEKREETKEEIVENEIEKSPVDEAIEKMDDTKKIAFTEQMDKLEKGEETADAKSFEEMYVKIFGSLPKETKQEEKEKTNSVATASDILSGENISVFEDSEHYQAKPEYKYIGIAFRTYIILEMQDELYIMDQHAAHERIMYEKVKKNFYSDTNKDSQLMILPDIITLTHKEMGIAKDNLELFEKAGFMIEEFGENTIKISGTPSICLDLDTKELFLETLDEINTVARTAKQEIEEKFIATVACKAAVKAHMALSKEEVESLLDQLLVLPNPFTCPHGRPTVIKMTKNDIEKKFSRR